MVIEEVNPPFEIGWVILPSKQPERRSEQPAAQPSSLPLIPLSQEGSLVQKVETALERIEPNRMPILVTETGNEDAILESEVTPLSTLMPPSSHCN